MEKEAESMEGVEYPLQLAGLSEDVIIEILTRLPVKSLLKFKCVSKAWYSLISTKYFIEAHLKNSTNNKSFSRHKIIANVRHQRWRVEQYCFRSLQSERRTYSSRFHRMLDSPKALHLIGSCNGLICILIDRKYLFLWNPATRVSKKLPPISHVGQIEIIQCGFGFDESSDDYKVFVILTVNNFDKFAQVYTLKADAWKRVEIVDVDIFTSRTVEGKLANGKLHWMLLGSSNTNFAAFDLKRETYGMLELPIYIGASFVPTLGVLNGCLCLLCDSYVTNRLDVWIWDQYGKQDSWTRLLTICDPQENKPIPHPLCVLPNKDVLFIYGSSLMSYNSTKKLGWHHGDSYGVVGAEFFVESLVSLPSDDVNTRGNPRKRGRASSSKLLSL